MILLLLAFALLNARIFSEAKFASQSPAKTNHFSLDETEPSVHHHLGYILQQRAEVLNEENFVPVRRAVSQMDVTVTDTLIPTLQSAMLSSDGRYCVISFSVQTDKGGYSYSFPCTNLFTFSGDSLATCYWQDSSTIVIYPDLTTDPLSALSVGSIIMLSIVNNIYSVCPTGVTNCEPAMAFPQTQIVEAPLNPVTPTVVFNAPSAISGCASWTVDLTASSGDGGRGWSSKQIVVTSDTADVKFLQGNFTAKFRTDKPFTIPSGAFVVGSSYSISLTLCNLFAKCGQSTFNLEIRTTGSTPPVASVVGSSTRTMYTTNSLSLTGSGYVLTCSGGQDSSSITYDWFVANGTGIPTVIPGLGSASKNPNNFLLQPYTIQGAGKYFVALTVTDKRTALSTQVLVTVYVLTSPVVATISPSTQQLVKVGKSVTLSGQSSFDPDAIAQGISGFRFLWRCSRSLPSVSTLCPFNWKNVTSSLSKVELSPLTSAINGTYLIRMTAIKGRRNATASVTIKVIEGSAPLITVLTSTAALTSINPANRVLVSARILSNFTCNSAWTTTASDITLKNIALVSTTATVQPTVPTVVNLFLAANGLAPQSSYTFTLTCERSRASVVVTTNGPPVGGVLSVSNLKDGTLTGIELTDTFEFVTSSWSDPDLPITYSFGFITPSTGALSVFQSRSETTFASTTLPGAPSGLQSLVLVYDVLSCSTSVNQTLYIKSLPAAQVQSLILKKLNSTQGSTSIDSIKAVISVASASLGSVNCSLVSNSYCANLNRSPCGSTSQLCGTCLTGFIGDGGDANTICYSQSGLNSTTLPQTCSSSNPCPSLYTCQSGKCVAVQKSCSNNCYGNGVCQYLDSNTGSIVSTCSVLSTSCVASCKCNTGFQGATCSISSADASSQQNLRYLLLSGLSTVVNYEDPTNETVGSAVNSISALVQTQYDLNQDSVPVFQTISQNALASAVSDSTIDLSSITGLLTVTNIAIQAQTSLSGNEASGNASSPIAFASQVISSYNSVLLRQQVPGQSAVSSIFSNFRTTSIDQSLATANNVSVSIPLSSLEKTTGAVASSISTSISNDSLSEVNLQLTQISASLVTPANNSKVLSNVLQFRVSESSAPVIVKITNFDSVPSQTQLNFTSQCEGKTDTRTLNYTCPGSGYVITHDCTGRTGPMTSQCPIQSAQCNLVNMTGSNPYSAKGVCNVIEATDTYTICSCLTNTTTSDGRRLSSSLAEQSGLYNLMAMSQYTTDELVSTFNAAPSLTSAAALEQVLTVIVMFGVLWVGGLIIIFGTVWRQQKSKSKHEEKKNILIRSVEKNPPTNKNMKESLVRYIRSVFPSVFYQDNWLMQLKEEILKNHVYLILLTAPKGEMEDKKRIISGVRILTVQTCLMCLLAIFYDLQCPSDDGSCDSILTQDDCLKRTSILDDTQTYCQWNQYAADLPDGTCSFNNPNITFKTALYVQVIVSVISLFIMKPVDIAFDTLLAPTERDVKVIRSKEHALESSFYATSMIQTGMRRISSLLTGGGRGSVQPLHASQLEQLENMKRMKRVSSVRQISDSVQRNHIVAQAILKSQTFRLDSSIKIPQPGDINERFDADGMLEMIFRQRELLKAEELELYDLAWGIDGVDVIQADVGATHRPAHFQIKPEVKEKMRKHIESLQEEYPKLKTKISDNTLTRSQRGLEILYEFILDLLGRDTPAAKIFRAKSEEDFQQLQVVHLPVKIFCGAVIVALNAFFIYYSLLRGYVRGQQWQHDYLVACIIQLIAEVFLFQTMECVWINFIVPNLVSKQVHQTHEIIEELVERVCNHIRKDSDKDHILNSADYLFMSQKLASLHPTLIESLLVFTYRSHLPGEVCRKWLPPEDHKVILHEGNLTDEDIERTLSARQRYERRHKTWKDVSIVASFFVTMQIIGTFPFFIQKMMVRFIQPFFYGGMVNAFQIVFSSTIYTIIFVILLLMVIAFIATQIMYSSKRRARVSTPRSNRTAIPVSTRQITVHAEPITMELVKQEEAENYKPLLEEDYAPTHSQEDSKEDSKESKMDSSETDQKTSQVGASTVHQQQHPLKQQQQHHTHRTRARNHDRNTESKDQDPLKKDMKAPERVVIRHEGMKNLSRKDRKIKPDEETSDLPQATLLPDTNSTLSSIQVPKSDDSKSDQVREARVVEGASVTTASNVERGKADGSVTSGSLDDLYSGGLSSSVSEFK